MQETDIVPFRRLPCQLWIRPALFEGSSMKRSRKIQGVLSHHGDPLIGGNDLILLVHVDQLSEGEIERDIRCFAMMSRRSNRSIVDNRIQQTAREIHFHITPNSRHFEMDDGQIEEKALQGNSPFSNIPMETIQKIIPMRSSVQDRME